MLKNIQEEKVKLMKQRRLEPEQEHLITIKINGLNAVLTDFKSVAVGLRTTVQDLPENELVKSIKSAAKRLDKEIEAYGKEHSKAKDAQIEKDFILTFIPDSYKSEELTTEEMDKFIKELKEKSYSFKEIMNEAKKRKISNMRYISQNAK